jgi:oxygen-independent coproporphyrinogen-3 oxidase
MEPVGIYISVPFCRAKCTFCNFASDAFGAGKMDAYVDRLCAEIGDVRQHARSLEAILPDTADSVYLGGGTPSLLESGQMQRIFAAIRNQFHIETDSEITLESAPGQLAESTLEQLLNQGLNRVSLGVQSFVDAESSAVGRLHTRSVCHEEITRLQKRGLATSVDLIVGLPLQTRESWLYSLDEVIASSTDHVSVYMLEMDEESRLGRESLRGGKRYGAGELPSDDDVADWYELACETLASAGIRQYEISNFARTGSESCHNLKYWQRSPYIGFGLDAHSMLRTHNAAVRFQNGDKLDAYLGDSLLPMLKNRAEPVNRQAAFEETLFLGLRLNSGVNLLTLAEEFGPDAMESVRGAFAELVDAKLVWQDAERLGLSAAGRVISNEIFGRLLNETEEVFA